MIQNQYLNAKGAASGAKVLGSAPKGANLASGIEAAGQVAGLAVSTIAQVSDANQRRRFEQNLAFLNAEQQNALNKELMSTQSASERLKIISEYLTFLNAKRISNLVSSVNEKEKKKRLNLILIASGLGLAAILIVYTLTKD